jgi:hypothetical protein
MVVLVVMALMLWLGAGALDWMFGANVSESATEMTTVFRRTGQLAAESREMHRVVLDLDAQTYRVETCVGGPAALTKDPGKPAAKPEEEEERRRAAIEEAKLKIAGQQQVLPTGADPEQGDVMALALANELAARQSCTVSAALFGDPSGRGTVRALDPNRSAKIKSVWVQHLEDPVTAGLVAIHFFPVGSAEKAIIEIGDSSNTVTVLVHGLTGRVEVRGGALRDPEGFMMRDAVGEEVQER